MKVRIFYLKDCLNVNILTIRLMDFNCIIYYYYYHLILIFLNFEKVNEFQYPRLTNMTRDYLAIPSIRVPSEQCFSTSKYLITDTCNRLAKKIVRAYIYLKSWWEGLKN